MTAHSECPTAPAAAGARPSRESGCSRPACGSARREAVGRVTHHLFSHNMRLVLHLRLFTCASTQLISVTTRVTAAMCSDPFSVLLPRRMCLSRLARSPSPTPEHPARWVRIIHKLPGGGPRCCLRGWLHRLHSKCSSAPSSRLRETRETCQNGSSNQHHPSNTPGATLCRFWMDCRKASCVMESMRMIRP